MKHAPSQRPTTAQPTIDKPLEILSRIVRAFDATGNNSAAANYARSLQAGMF